MLATQAVLAYDPSITTDFGLVGATSGENFTSKLFEPSKLPAATAGLTLVPAFAAQFPGLTGLGISSVFFILGSFAEIPPHTHPRATELFYVISGTFTVGFIDTTNTLFTANLEPGDEFVFPQALIHFQLNTANGTATALSSFNSENPGLQITATSLFASTPTTVPDIILAGAFNVSVKVIEKIKTNLAG